MHLARGCVRLALLQILYLYEGKSGGKKWINISSNLQVIQDTQSCISELFLFQTNKKCPCDVEGKEGWLFDKLVRTKSILDNCVFRYDIIGRGKGVV